MGNFTYRGIRKPYLTVPRGLKLPAWAPVRREIKTVPGKPGGYVSRTDIEVREIQVPIRIKADSFSNLQELKEDLADWLVTNEVQELIFDDEPNRTYFAMVDGSLDLNEIVSIGKGAITFICPDPYKYAPVNTMEISNPMVITVEGSEPTPPFFRLNVWNGITGIDIVRDNAYMSIGQPEEVGKTVYQEKTNVLYEQFNGALIGWANTAILPYQGTISGNHGIKSNTVYAESYGSGTSWHGPALQRTFDPIDNYNVRVYFYVKVTSTKQRGKAETYLLAENGAIMGRIAAEVSGASMKINVLVELWNGANRKSILYKNRAYHSLFFGYLEINRRGNEYTVILGEQTNIKPDRYTVAKQQTFKWTDVYEEYNQRLAGVVFYLATHGKSEGANLLRLRALHVNRYNEKTGDIPAVLNENEIVEIDHGENTILVDGVDRIDLKDFGANFFMLEPGDNILMIEPSNHLTGIVEWRDRFK